MSNLIKKSFLISMVVMTAMWGLGGVINVTSVDAASAGDLIKSASSPAVYYLDSNNVKHPFHHAREYDTWYQNFDGVVTVSTDEMVGYTLGSTVVVRPGSRLAQYVEVLGDGTWSVSNSPSVYAVGADGGLHHVTSAAVAVEMYGANWESMIIPLPNYLAANYSAASDLVSGSDYPEGTLLTSNGTDAYYIENGMKRLVANSAAFSANNFDWDYAVTVANTVLEGYSDGTSVTGYESSLTDPVAGLGGVAVGTGLTAALAVGNPGAQTAPLSATGVELMKINFTASSDGAVTISDLKVKRMGVGATADFSNLYIYEGAERLTNGKTLNSSTHIATFTNLDVTVAAGTSKILTLVADLAASTQGNVNYFVVNTDYIETTATINGSFPLQSNTLTMGASTAGTVTVAQNGTLTNPVVGQQDVAVAQFKLTAGTGEDLSIERVTLYSSGGISNSYLTDLKLYQGSDLLGSTASIASNGLMTFDLAVPYALDKNTNRIFKVTADISASAKDTDYTKIYLENNADIHAIGEQYGYGAGVTSTDYDGNDTSCTTQGTCSDSTYLDIDSGQITVAFNGPTSATLAQGGTEVVFLNFSVTSGADAEIRKMRVELHNDDGAAAELDKDSAPCSTNLILNVKIVDTDNGDSTSAVNCSSFSDIDSADGVYYDFTDYFTLESGQTRNFAIKADLATTLTANDYYVVLGSSGSAYTAAETAYTLNTSDGVKNTENNQWITDIVPTTHTQGNDMTVAAASLGIALASNAVATTIVQGTDDVVLAHFAFNTGTGSDITVNSMTLSGYIDPDGSGATSSVLVRRNSVQEAGMSASVNVSVNDIISNLRIYDTTDDPGLATNLNGTAEGFSSSDGKATFANINWTIPAGETHVFTVIGDVVNTAFTQGDTGAIGTVGMAKYVKVNFGAATDITAEDESNNSVTLTDDDLTAYAVADANGAVDSISSSAYISIAASGTLNVTAESNPAISNLVAGTSDVPMLNLKFQATDESFNVNKLRIAEIQSPATSSRAVTSVTISYQNQAGQTVTATQAMVSAISDFNITSNPLYVPAGGNRTVNVYYNLNPINAATLTYTGDEVMARFYNTGNFEAKAAGSGSTNLTATSNTTNVDSSVMVVHGALLTITADTPTAALQTGPADLYRWQVSATEGGTNVSLKKLSFKLSLTDSVINSATLYLQNFQVYEGSSYTDTTVLTQGDNGTNHYQVYNGWGATGTDATGVTGGKLSATTGKLYHNIATQGAAGASASTSHDIIVVFNDDRLITAGASKYYILKATAYNVDGGASSNDSLGMYMYDGDTSTTDAKFLDASCNMDKTGTPVMTAGKYCLNKIAQTVTPATDSANNVDAYFIWSDNTGTAGDNTHTDTAVNSTAGSKDWFNGYKIKTLDVQRTLN